MINSFEKNLRIILKELEIKKKTSVLSDEEEHKLKKILILLEKRKEIDKLSDKEKKLYSNILNLNSIIRSYKLGAKAIFLAKEHEKNEEWYKMSIKVHNNYKKELKEIYEIIKNCPKKSFDKIMKIHDFSESYKKDFDESMNFIEKFILKNDK
jgi:hypothetical protein